MEGVERTSLEDELDDVPNTYDLEPLKKRRRIRKTNANEAGEQSMQDGQRLVLIMF